MPKIRKEACRTDCRATGVVVFVFSQEHNTPSGLEALAKDRSGYRTIGHPACETDETKRRQWLDERRVRCDTAAA
ncbi:Hypothetical predicted protein [Octopus vulgaris]|uniref:Uncharacterized protein n=1 Tax=Octopus vulgaris TaxID=6645 RepID=A0AA36B564_OCTVU|nr:Hypothetical predicted protein [Octopus vulgaris]